MSRFLLRPFFNLHILYSIFFSILLCFFSCHKNSNQKKILEYPLQGEINTLDSTVSYDVISSTVIHNCVETLYEYHYLKRPYTIIPLLAEELPKVENNGLRYIIKIKKNIPYQTNEAWEGKPRYVKAQDFVTQIKRLAFIPNASTGWWLFDGKIKGLNEFRKKVGTSLKLFYSTPVSGLTTPDDHTLIIDLTEPYPTLDMIFTMSFTSPMPEEAVKKYHNTFTDKVIGTGPFIMKKWNRLSGATLVRNPKYHKAYYPSEGDRVAHAHGLLKDAGKRIPFLDGINFHIMKENQTRWLNFLSKKIHIIFNIPKEIYDAAFTPQGELKEELKENNIKMQVFPTLTYWWLSFNMKNSIFAHNKNLRLAIAHAINMDQYLNIFTNNLGQKANSIYPPGVAGYNPSKVLPYTYNLSKAKQYMKKAGYPEGKGLPPITYDIRGPSATARQQGEFLRTQLKKIGIETIIATNSFPKFIRKSITGELQFWQGGWTLDYPNAENILQLLYTKNHAPGPNATSYSNPKFDSLFDKFKVMPEGESKKELMSEMENIVLKDLPWIMQYYDRNYVLFNGRVKNFRKSDLNYNMPKYLRLD